MQPIIAMNEVWYTYAGRSKATLKNICLTIQPGEFVLLTGASGCGKSTLLKLLNGLIPQASGGVFNGDVTIAGHNTREVKVADLSHIVGLLFQCPDDQIFADRIFDEVAFVLENLGLSSAEVELRVNEVLMSVGLGGKGALSVQALSGGQRQRLALAAVLAAKPTILALDEPISQIDPVNAESLLQLLGALQQSGVTIIVVEHRLHEVIDICTRVLIMNAGELVWDGTAEQALVQPSVFESYGLRLPQIINICKKLQLEITNDVATAAEWIRSRYEPLPVASCNNKQVPLRQSVVAKDVCFSYDNQNLVLCNLSRSFCQGEIVALMGSNGAGKSTLLQHLAGLLQPSCGQVYWFGSRQPPAGKIGFVMQNPDFMLFNPTVKDEVLFGPRQLQQPVFDETRLYQQYAQRLNFVGLERDFPLALSRGQRLRVAVAAILSFKPKLLLLDEPTTGQDISRIDDILELLRDYAATGGTVVFCTHDTEIAATVAGRIVILQQGQIIADGSPAAVLSDPQLLRQAGLKQPPVMQLATELGLTGIVSVEEVVAHCAMAGINEFKSGYAAAAP